MRGVIIAKRGAACKQGMTEDARDSPRLRRASKNRWADVLLTAATSDGSIGHHRQAGNASVADRRAVRPGASVFTLLLVSSVTAVRCYSGERPSEGLVGDAPAPTADPFIPATSRERDPAPRSSTSPAGYFSTHQLEKEMTMISALQPGTPTTDPNSSGTTDRDTTPTLSTPSNGWRPWHRREHRRRRGSWIRCRR